MSKEADAGAGLLGKVAKFIKNPTMNWGEVERSGPPATQEGSPATSQLHFALKEMIKRKRTNDLVRLREFDVLRKIRRTGKQSSDALNTMELTSSYTSSQFGYDAEGGGQKKRERTLRQIDEIEAQLSRSWFRNKSSRQQPLNRLPDLRPDNPLSPELETKWVPIQDQPEPPVLTQTYQPEIAAGGMTGVPALAAHRKPEDQKPPPMWQDSRAGGLARHSSFNELSASKPAADAYAAAHPPESQPQSLSQSAKPVAPPKTDSSLGSAFPFKAVNPLPVSKPEPSRPIAFYEDPLKDDLEVVTLQQDPEIEGVAISFANGDETAAESALLKLVSFGNRRREEIEVWLALFDLYRAAGKYDAFNDLVPKFITLFGRSAPQWERVPDKGISDTAGSVPQKPRTGFFTWVSPPQINADALEALTRAVSHTALPWRIDWCSIKTVEPDVLPRFNALFAQWADTPLQLQFRGGEQLLAVLTEQSTFRNKSANLAWWHVRMTLLRLMGAADQFDQTALNYCMTYEISPPAWIPPKGSYTPLDADGQPESESIKNPLGAQTFAPPTMTSNLLAATGVFVAALEGEILGSAKSALAALPGDLEHIQAIDFDCRALRRVDFGAAGGLLNWSIEQQNQGRTVTFRDMHRLLAAFFSVIGINAAAQVILRKD
jgi:hypothetical protein